MDLSRHAHQGIFGRQVTVNKQLDAAEAASMDIDKLAMNESVFRWMLNEDAMATEKLAEGIRSFASDLDKLRSYLAQRMELVTGRGL